MTRCRVCRRPLRDPESVALGIGPECRVRYGPDLQLRLDGLEPEGGSDEDKGDAGHAVEVVAKEDGGREQCGTLVLGSLVAVVFAEESVPTLATGHGEVIRYPIRARWWLRLWRWLRGGVR